MHGDSMICMEIYMSFALIFYPHFMRVALIQWGLLRDNSGLQGVEVGIVAGMHTHHHTGGLPLERMDVERQLVSASVCKVGSCRSWKAARCW